MPEPNLKSPPPLIAAGDGWLIVDKPAGLSVHNQPGRDACSLAAEHLGSAVPGGAPEMGFGLHAVHRLDRETSGLLLLAFRRQVFDSLSREFASGRVEKEYLALVHGRISPGREGAWEWLLSGSAAGRRDPQGREPRAPSVTWFRSIRSGRRYSLLSCLPRTGRTHQIRRHAALAGHPILGDRRYGSARACRYLAEHHAFTRLALHAAALAITLPGCASPQRFESPGLPEAIRVLLDEDLVNTQ